MRAEKELRFTINSLDDYMHEASLELQEIEDMELVIDTILYCLNEPVKYNDRLFPEPIMIRTKLLLCAKEETQ